jgi:hypothetical protein
MEFVQRNGGGILRENLWAGATINATVKSSPGVTVRNAERKIILWIYESKCDENLVTTCSHNVAPQRPVMKLVGL